MNEARGMTFEEMAEVLAFEGERRVAARVRGK
jgi:hypothetical protein